MDFPDHVELAIIGAGWNGLAMAKTYLECHPNAKLIVLDKGTSIGGVWAKDRLYPHLKSNNVKGNLEYSDFPMDLERFGVKPGEHIPGATVHEYLFQYSKEFGIYSKIRLGAVVGVIERSLTGGWTLNVQSGKDSVQHQLHADKVVFATGLTSEAWMPDFHGLENYACPVYHVKDLAHNTDQLYQTARNVTVIGGTKSGWDAAYTCANAGIHVDMIVRKSGHGPAWMSWPKVTPFKMYLEKLVHTRFLTWFSPCIWGDFDGFSWIRKFLHGTRIGRFFVDSFWTILNNDLLQGGKYDNHSETKKLKPWISPFWIASSLSIFNYDTDFFELVRNGKINVHIEDVSGFAEKSVQLSSGATLSSDALICATGWKHRPPVKFLPSDIEREIGLPKRPSSEDEELAHVADKRILDQFPRLRNQPNSNPEYKPMDGSEPAVELHPYRLYRFMVPPAFADDRNIAFMGAMQSISTAMIAQVQALWLTAYLDGTLDLETETWNDRAQGEPTLAEKIVQETYLDSQFGKWRCPGGYGNQFPDIVFDCLPYIDMLLRQLGLSYHRKRNLIAEVFDSYSTSDYRGLVDEWRTKVGK
ncbi:FAD/NAD(P)-binding domain-containing protein [Xylona heveae TC161]|uniref:FAD/NAD(P)-binding domain-containing protein n=1 Tax=Xylona heveae (strain CBS 132557 / TC161) TaxID=1328760 RepID=A0A164ZTX9_XYLHT|nr:FAD/NAD(P)-binding domain-containing protein [Xylona heveae TC161]KZF19512.1 FAD/NAD(P)-binding domain-containing protein [Xylona heveae TC161]